MAGFIPIVEQIVEEEGPVVEEEAAAAGEAIAAEAQVLEQKAEVAAEAVSAEAKVLAQEVESEGKAIFNKLEEALSNEEVGQVETKCEPEGASNAAEASEEALASSNASTGVPEPQVTDPKLQNLVRDLYKGAKTDAPVGTGSTADAIRQEILTGEPVGGKFHTEKGIQYSQALSKWLAKNPSAASADRAIAQRILDDLTEALKGN